MAGASPIRFIIYDLLFIIGIEIASIRSKTIDYFKIYFAIFVLWPGILVK